MISKHKSLPKLHPTPKSKIKFSMGRKCYVNLCPGLLLLVLEEQTAEQRVVSVTKALDWHKVLHPLTTCDTYPYPALFVTQMK